jgi:predicted amidohydrolase
MSAVRYHAAACQVDRPNPRRRDEIPANVDRMLEMAEFAVAGYRPLHDVRLLVFPEFAITAPVYDTAEELIEKLAEPVPNEQTDRLLSKARELGVWIQCGSQVEVDPRWPDTTFNATMLAGPEGYLTKYRKVNPWIPWEVHASPHDVPGYEDELFPVAETEIGRLGVATCYDWLFPEVTRQLAVNGAEVLIRISAYMDPWGATPPMDWWSVVNRARAIENQAAVVAANQGATLGNYPPFSWPGGSMIVDFEGRIMAQADPGPGEKIVVGPVDLAALREARTRFPGHALLAHLRTDAYAAYRAPGFRGATRAEARTVNGLDELIRQRQGDLFRGDLR